MEQQLEKTGKIISVWKPYVHSFIRAGLIGGRRKVEQK